MMMMILKHCRKQEGRVAGEEGLIEAGESIAGSGVEQCISNRRKEAVRR